MNIEDVLTLAKAGFNKEDIINIINTSNPYEALPEPEPAADPAPAAGSPEPAAEPAEDNTKNVNEAITEALKPFEDLYEKMAKMAGMPSINDVQPKGIEDVISNFFK